jgi:hypothetical protein
MGVTYTALTQQNPSSKSILSESNHSYCLWGPLVGYPCKRRMNKTSRYSILIGRTTVVTKLSCGWL